MNDLVECRSESTYAERPTALLWQGQRLEIRRVLASWRTPEGVSHRVRTEDGHVFELAYNEDRDLWDVEEA